MTTVEEESRTMDHAVEYHDYEFVAELYDSVVPYASRQDVEFFVDAAKSSGGPVLEVGCGTGRVLIPTARAGMRITGLDLSTHMLKVCRERLEQEPADVRRRVRLIRDDMRSFDLGDSFALITIPFRPFLHLTTVEDQLACLSCIRRHLLPDGRFILDIFNPWLELIVADDVGTESEAEPAFTLPDGRRVTRRYKFVSKDRANQVNHLELIYSITHPDGREERLVHAFSMRYLYRFEAEHLLARAGFRVEHLFGDYDKSPFGAKYPGELIFVAKKT